jgi:excisionase family DNA binding protein
MFSAEIADECAGISPKGSNSANATKPAIEPLLLSVKDCAALLGLGRSTVWEMVRSGELQSIRIRDRRLIKRADLELFLNKAAQ